MSEGRLGLTEPTQRTPRINVPFRRMCVGGDSFVVLGWMASMWRVDGILPTGRRDHLTPVMSKPPPAPIFAPEM